MLRIHFDAALIFMTFIHNIYKICETFPPFHPYSVLFANRFESEAKNARFLFFFQNSKKIGVFEIPCQVNEKFDDCEECL